MTPTVRAAAAPADVPARPRRMSLRVRLTFTYAALFVVAGVVLLGVTYVLFTQKVAEGRVKVISTTQRTGGPGNGAAQPSERYMIDGPGGPPTAGSQLERLAREQSDRLREAAATSLITQGAVALAVVGGAATGFAWLIAGRTLAPLHRVTETARRIAAAPAADRGLHERIALRGPDDEVKELADTFDSMLERLDRSFDGQRRFVANASHELRTPLTLGRALVELAMHRRSASPDVRRLGESLLQINARHERLIDGLLLLARSDHEITERAPVDLADVVGHVTAQTEAEARETGVRVHEQADEAPTSGDALLLERLVQNLVENGIRHNVPDGGWVRVSSRTRGDGMVEVEVANTGPVVPPYEIAGLFEPFRRMNRDRVVDAKGAGLGLSIVRSIARAHGGAVTAVPRDGGGLVVTVTLPAEPGAAAALYPAGSRTIPVG
ncbi:sensor protein CutS [Actinomadura sp. NBRC 104425]|uniref:sensor histidine kinase n=1 Tax=Actinomadura sp. NBRC 104425 TaxID=3032204 RepID=UPI0024A305EA|nr:HAMP domain-containing sensor histidine kinase [Actinomadura sp. NBRC 104425]GLZ16411.1 sensor protein CutS [Actinomadura sp. NBRC 104425]